MGPLGGLAAALVIALGADVQAAPKAVVCAGGETLRPLLRAWAQAARKADPTLVVRIDPGATLSADGMRLFLSGRADCVSMVREPFPSERVAFRRKFGREPLLVPVAGGSFATRGGTHAIAIYVNAANPIRALSLSQLEAAFGASPRGRASGPARTWGDLGLDGDWAGRPLHVYGMTPRRESGDPPGVVNFLQRRVLGGGAFRRDVAVQVDRPGEQALAAIVRKVANDPDGLGYSGFGYALPGARAVPVVAGAAEPVAGSPASVADGTYPLARRIYLLVDRAPGRRLEPHLRRFLGFVLSATGQAMIAADAEGFLPLAARERTAARHAIE